MFPAWNRGEMARWRSASTAGSPISSNRATRCAPHQAGMDCRVRTQLVTPKMSMPASNLSGWKARAAAVM
ncbi:hypothetical protein D3C80_1593260 [compost metagenome]